MTEALSSAMQGISAESGRAMNSGTKPGAGGDEAGIAELFKVNQLYYRLPPTLSLVSKRASLVNQAQRTSYPEPYSDVITFVFNTGEYYVSMPTSYLFFSIGYNNPTTFATAKALIAQGNAMSLFEEVVLIAASGTEICREQNKGLNSAFKYHYEHSQEYIDTIGALQGAPQGSYSSLHDGVGPVFATTLGGNPIFDASNFPAQGSHDGIILPRSGEAAKNYFGYSATNINRMGYRTQLGPTFLQFAIPMVQVLGCFRTYCDSLFPAGALAGARLEMRLKNPTESMQFVGSCKESVADATSDDTLTALITQQQTALRINQIYLVMDAFQLQDNVLKRLNKVASGQDGLSLLFDTYDHTTTPASGQGTVEAQVQQARSRIIRSWVVVRDNANLTNPYINSLAAEGAVTRVCASIYPGYTMPVVRPITVASVVVNSTGFSGSYNPVSIMNHSQAPASGVFKITDAGTDTLDGGWLTYTQTTKFPTCPVTNDYKNQTPIVSSYQCQLGSLFMPLQPFTQPSEYYQNALFIFGKSIPNKDLNCSVKYSDFLGGLGYGLYTDTTNGIPINPTLNSKFGNYIAPYGLAVYGMLAEKSQALQLSGLPISNARLLRHKFTFATPPMSGTSRILNVFTDYTRVMKVFLGGRIVVRE